MSIEEQKVMATESARPIEIFYCYASKDLELRNQLDAHLSPLKPSGQIITWHDREIQAGMDWKKEIDRRLNTADIILLLVSADFMQSKYYEGKEMEQALKRHGEGKARIIP